MQDKSDGFTPQHPAKSDDPATFWCRRYKMLVREEAEQESELGKRRTSLETKGPRNGLPGKGALKPSEKALK